MNIWTRARSVLRRRWVRATLITAVAITIVGYGVLAVGATGGVILRDDDGCPRSVGALGSVSWVDVLQIEGATYRRVDTAAPASTADPTLGQRLATIRCAIGADVQRAGYDLRDGEATFLPPGTPVHAIAGTHPDFRVVAVEDGRPAVYEHRPRRATTGADLLPFPASDVTAVRFLSEVDGRTVLGELEDGQAVQELVTQLQAAPVGPRPDLGEEPRVFVALVLPDQPPVTLVTYPRHAITTDGLHLPDEVVARLPAPGPARAVGRGPDVSPGAGQPSLSLRKATVSCQVERASSAS